MIAESEVTSKTRICRFIESLVSIYILFGFYLMVSFFIFFAVAQLVSAIVICIQLAPKNLKNKIPV